jgi:hypothetical protein
MKKGLLIVGGVCACLLAVLAVTRSASDDGMAGPAVNADVPEVQSGYSVHIDAATGEFREAAPATATAAEVDPAVEAALSRSTEGLVEVDAPGGGKMVDLQGRFQHTYVATMGDDGVLTVECDTDNEEEE